MPATAACPGLTILLPWVVQAGARSNWSRATAAWYLTSNLKLVANYTQTQFDGGAAAGRDREDEKAFFTRAQLAF